MNAFEQSLQNMTNRLQQLTATTEKKVFLEFMFILVHVAFLAEYQDGTLFSLSSVWLWLRQFPSPLFKRHDHKKLSFFPSPGIGNNRNASNH